MNGQNGEVAISLRNISKAYFTEQQGRVLALDNISLDIDSKTFVALIGPSGCGKSTVLNLIAGLSAVTSGHVLYKGRDVTTINTEIGYVTQEHKLFPWMTLEENVSFPLEVRGMPRPERERRIKEYLELVGLTSFEKHYPYQLSGGMQKRASLIRTIIYDPDVLLMDEPFGPLDAQTKMIMQDELLKLWAHRKKTIVFVTHDLVEAIALADVVVVLSNRPARIKEIIKVPLSRPRKIFKIHEQEGFAETYDRLWQVFRTELEVKEA